jgi:hypothetical protein
MKANVYKFIDILNSVRPVKNQPVDNDFNMGYANCADLTNTKIDNVINDLKKQMIKEVV